MHSIVNERFPSGSGAGCRCLDGGGVPKCLRTRARVWRARSTACARRWDCLPDRRGSRVRGEVRPGGIAVHPPIPSSTLPHPCLAEASAYAFQPHPCLAEASAYAFQPHPCLAEASAYAFTPHLCLAEALFVALRCGKIRLLSLFLFLSLSLFLLRQQPAQTELRPPWAVAAGGQPAQTELRPPWAARVRGVTRSADPGWTASCSGCSLSPS